MFCMKCGKELKDGEICDCEQTVNQEQAQVTQNVQPENSNATNVNQQQNKGFTNFIKNFGLLFVKPVDAIRDSVKNSRWVNGLVYILIFSAVLAVFSTFSTVFQSLKYYNSAVSSAQERYNTAKNTYGENSFSAKMYKSTLNNAKENRREHLTSGEFIVKTIGNFVKSFVSPILTILLITAILFVIGKILKGKGSFGQIFAGMGLVYNLKYLSDIILPLIGKLPIIGKISVIASGVTVIYGVLVFVVFKESFELDDNKNILSVFTAFALLALISTIVLTIISGISAFIMSL